MLTSTYVKHLKSEFERVVREDLAGCTLDELCGKIAEFNLVQIGEAMDHIDEESFSNPLERLTELVVKAQLTAHVEGTLSSFRDSRKLFVSASAKTIKILDSSTQPNPSLKEDPEAFSVGDYWMSVACECPELRFVVRLLASERVCRVLNWQ